MVVCKGLNSSVFRSLEIHSVHLYGNSCRAFYESFAWLSSEENKPIVVDGLQSWSATSLEVWLQLQILMVDVSYSHSLQKIEIIGMLVKMFRAT